MTLSLRARLLIGVVALLVVGVIFDVVTYAAMRSSLVTPIEKQLVSASTRSTAQAVLSHPDCNGRGPSVSTNFPNGSVTEHIGDDGAVLQWCTLGPFGNAGSDPGLKLPSTLVNHGTDNPSRPFTVSGAARSTISPPTGPKTRRR
jgi:hypothetical protein